jgi:hypothetical protein
MERFYETLKTMEPPGKVQKLEQIIHFLRSNNTHQHADALLELKNCYSEPLLFKNERKFRAYLAWCHIYDLPHHPAFAHVLTQT